MMMKMSCVHLFPSVCLIGFGLLLPPLAQSTTLARLSLAQLAVSARAIVRAQVVSSNCQWRDGEIWTVTSFRVIENWKGNSPAQINVWMIGGSVGRITSYVPGAPRFRAGEQTVLFLEPTRSGTMSITAWGEGTFRVHIDARTNVPRVTQDTAIAPEYDAPTHTFRSDGIRDMPVAQLKMRVLEAEAARSAR
jgi:hypothetical protein